MCLLLMKLRGHSRVVLYLRLRLPEGDVGLAHVAVLRLVEQWTAFKRVFEQGKVRPSHLLAVEVVASNLRFYCRQPDVAALDILAIINCHASVSRGSLTCSSAVRLVL